LKKILVLGSSGMLGHMVFDVLSKTFDVYENNKFLRVDDFFKNDVLLGRYDYVINCIGLIKQKMNDDLHSKTEAVKINTLFPLKLSEKAEKENFKVIQIATDCVFSGNDGYYKENDNHDTNDIYGITKSMGEYHSKNVYLLRCSIIGPERGNKSLMGWFLNQPKNAVIEGFANHYWNGITTYHFAKICEGIIKNDIIIENPQHIIPNDIVTKYQLLNYFKESFRNDINIEWVACEKQINRSLSTINEEMNKFLWKNSGYEKIPSIKEMISELKVIFNKIINT
jgi:dTDP-4-dehydrorhamnose reductase